MAQRRTMLVGVIVGLWFCAGGAWASKPSAPIKLSFTTSAPATPGAVVDLVLSATPHLEAEQFDLDIALPATVVLVSGVPHWSGTGSAEEPRSLTLRVRIPNEGHLVIHGTAAVKNGTSRFSVHESLAVGAPAPAIRANATAAGVVRSAPGAKGNSVVEFPLK